LREHSSESRSARQVAALLGAAPDEIVFASGGSSANNLAINGTSCLERREGPHIITTVLCSAAARPTRFDSAKMIIDHVGDRSFSSRGS